MHYNRIGNDLYIYFDGTEPTINGWAKNFFFLKKPYKNMGKVWLVHAGFLSIWKQLQDEIFEVVNNSDIDYVEIDGVSQGGAVAILCHEFIQYNFRDILVMTKTYGAPRVLGFWGLWRVKERFLNVKRIVNRGDIVAHVPPVLFGFNHVGTKDLRGKFTLNIAKAHGEYTLE